MFISTYVQGHLNSKKISPFHFLVKYVYLNMSLQMSCCSCRILGFRARLSYSFMLICHMNFQTLHHQFAKIQGLKNLLVTKSQFLSVALQPNVTTHRPQIFENMYEFCQIESSKFKISKGLPHKSAKMWGFENFSLITTTGSNHAIYELLTKLQIMLNHETFIFIFSDSHY